MNHGTQGYNLTKKTEGRKSRDTVPLKKKFLSATPRYATQCEIRVKNFLVDSPLCGIARSRFSSSNLIEYLRVLESTCKTVLAHESGDPGVQFNEKKPSVENLVTLSL
jgi:hypothetical protein